MPVHFNLLKFIEFMKNSLLTVWLIILLVVLSICIPFLSMSGHGRGAYPYQSSERAYGLDPRAVTVIGAPWTYRIRQGDTLLDIARNFNLGFTELHAPYKHLDPWVPPEGLELLIPTFWVLPDGDRDGILINVPEMRLYFFFKKISMVKTFPVGIGVSANETPLGRFYVREKSVSPTWKIPASLREKYGGRRFIPPGPENPIGSHWLGLSQKGYGIHGTNFPWSIGRLVTHGCIRLYPEDILHLFPIVSIGTPVHIIYEPVKIGFKEGRILVEVHEDIYQRIPDLLQFALQKVDAKGIRSLVDLEKLKETLDKRNGLPTDITSDSGHGK
jgi:L,D-transpeptidase ErfK/SrfK